MREPMITSGDLAAMTTVVTLFQAQAKAGWDYELREWTPNCWAIWATAPDGTGEWM